MSVGQGPWYLDDTLVWVTGPATVDADAAPTYRVYEMETATPILTGSMALLDSTNTVGLYSEAIALTAANGFEVGKSYAIYTEIVESAATRTQTDVFKLVARPAVEVLDVLNSEHLIDGSVGKAIADALLAINLTASNVIGLSTFDPATQKVTIEDIQGVDFASLMSAVVAAVSGVTSRVGSVLTFKLLDGTTTVLQVTVSGTPGVRSASVLTPL